MMTTMCFTTFIYYTIYQVANMINYLLTDLHRSICKYNHHSIVHKYLKFE